MQKIQLLVGSIASGKSTYCQNAAKNNYVICNDDAIFNCIHANQYLLYNDEWKLLYKSIENSVINNALLMGLSVIVDSARNGKQSRRRRFISWAHSFDIEIEAIVFPKETAEIHAKRRFESDGRGYPYEYWLKIIKAHAEIYTEPSLEEGFDVIHHITWEEIKSGLIY